MTAGVPRPSGPFVEPGQVRIFDTTLRDGEQSPGINLSAKEKVEIAQQLATLGVDIIEAGFPINSQAEFDAVAADEMAMSANWYGVGSGLTAQSA